MNPPIIHGPYGNFVDSKPGLGRTIVELGKSYYAVEIDARSSPTLSVWVTPKKSISLFSVWNFTYVGINQKVWDGFTTPSRMRFTAPLKNPPRLTRNIKIAVAATFGITVRAAGLSNHAILLAQHALDTATVDRKHERTSTSAIVGASSTPDSASQIA